MDGNDLEFQNTLGHDSTGRFIPYLHRGQTKEEIVLEAAKYYDSLSPEGDWYQVPKKQNLTTQPIRIIMKSKGK